MKKLKNWVLNAPDEPETDSEPEKGDPIKK